MTAATPARSWPATAARPVSKEFAFPPYTLRHTFAVLYIRNGGDSFSLQEILGHSTLEMTRRYVHLARRDVAEQHKKFSPMEGLEGGRKQEKALQIAMESV